ncbi:site-2 protease family protein, partial [Patescibacteria group bacterium]|nr:site-2 protease family protein [Patescibacteria group bacterium]
MIISGIITVIILVFSAILHEIAHGYVADRLGDPTARLLGRLTLNPKSHIDPVMSIALPLILILSGSPIVFGAAKPVPVDPFNLKEGRKDLAIVSIAGPLTNILIAIIASLLIKLISISSVTFLVLTLPILMVIAQINLLLAIFNLLPIPPLDGSKVFSLLLPEKEARAYLSLESIGFFILILLLMIPIGGFSLGEFIFNLLTVSK